MASEIRYKFTDVTEGHVAFHFNVDEAALTTVNVAN